MSAGNNGRPDQSPQRVQPKGVAEASHPNGAALHDWDYFEILLGLGDNMLPAVQASATPAEQFLRQGVRGPTALTAAGAE